MGDIKKKITNNMKKTITINLGGTVFNIDNDACDRLNQYLADIEKRFPEEDRTEILRDIEVRMAELLTFKLQARNVVEINDVEEVIEVIGRPEQFDDENVTDSEEKQSTASGSTAQQTTTDKKKKFRARKLYRNSNDRMVSGVASGLALRCCARARQAASASTNGSDGHCLLCG